MLRPGKQFEADFMSSAKQVPRLYIHRVKDCGGWRQECPCLPADQQTRFTPKNEYDFFMYWQGTFWALELKSVKEARFPFDRVRDRQATGLSEAAQVEGIVSGFIINFRTHEQTFFLPINAFLALRGDKASINLKSAADIGVQIEQHRLRVHWRYDVEQFVRRTTHWDTQ